MFLSYTYTCINKHTLRVAESFEWGFTYVLLANNKGVVSTGRRTYVTIHNYSHHMSYMRSIRLT
ncbi:hypothetical protein EON63_21320 [archaeon]|nr:MAG: hypothetical protein EON63_21320 [archaeon]